MSKLIKDDPNKMKFWDIEKNKDIDISKTKVSSKQDAWWYCRKCGYSWHTPVFQRKNGNCPCCDTGSVVRPGINDVFTKVPSLALDYNAALNDGRPDITTLGTGSHESYVWKCHKCGEEWSAPIYSRVRKKGNDYVMRKCPVCGGKKRANGFDTEYPELVSLYSSVNNVPFSEIPGDYHKLYWWHCSVADHPDFQAPLTTMIRAIRTGNSGCPYCHGIKTIHSDSLGVTHPELISEWSSDNDRTVFEISDQSHYIALWQCEEGHTWNAPVYTRAIGYGKCPICYPFGARRDSILAYHPEIERFYSEQNKHPVSGLSFRSHIPVLWHCVNGKSHDFKMTCDTIMRRGRLTCPICNLEQIIPGQNDFQTLYPAYAADYDDSNPIPVDHISPINSDSSVSWHCQNYGHSFKRSVATHIQSQGRCPVCERRVLVPDQNSIAATYPRIATLWDPSWNLQLPTEMFDTTNQPISLNCDAGHTYQTTVKKAVRQQCQCPVCAGTILQPGVNSLCETDPYLAAEWSPNNPMGADTVTKNSGLRVWWKCPECNGEFKAPISARYFGDTACPYCNEGRALAGFNTIEVTHPDVAACWSSRNRIPITHVTADMSFYDPFIWECPDCGGTYRADLQDRLSEGFECPICSGRKLLTGFNSFDAVYPELALEWSDTNGFTPDSILPTYTQRVWWDCKKCGSKYTARIADRLSRQDCCPYCAGRLVKSGLNSIADIKPDVAADWSSANPRPATDYLYTSPQSVLWTCSECGNDYIHSIYDKRVGNDDCPFCNERVPIPGVNSLADAHPELIEEWSPNNLRSPKDVVATSKFRALWVCKECGNEYEWPISSRYIRDRACPYCNERKPIPGVNSLADIQPELIEEWSPNNFRSPKEVVATSKFSALWVCPECHNEYTAPVNSRHVGDDACPYCANKRVLPGLNSLQDTNPDLAEEWSPNNNRGPDTLFETSAYQAFWICPECHGEYRAPVNSRRVGDDACPYCANRLVLPGFNSLQVTHSDLMNEWCVVENAMLLLDPNTILPSSSLPAWWQCSKCGEKYVMGIAQRVLKEFRQHESCPKCSDRFINRSHYLRRI